MTLRISPDRIWLYGSALAALNLVIAICVWVRGYADDWHVFFTAGSLVGSRALLDPFAWQSAHHLITSPFVYTPGFAWFYVPFEHIPLLQGAIANGIVAVALGIVCAVIAAELYDIPRSLAILAVLAWAPIGAVILEDQNAMFGLLLVCIAIAGLVRKSSLITGIAVGLLFYKPQYALPWILLLLFRKEWRALAVTTCCAVVWYMLSFVATGMDAQWFQHWIAVIATYATTDFIHNADKTISIPGLLQHIGVPSLVAGAIGLALLVYLAYTLRNAAAIEAGSLITIAGLACSPHAWDYDAVLALPAIFSVLTHVAEQLRTRAIVTAYVIAPLWVFAHPLHFDTLAIVTIGALVFLVVRSMQLRPSRTM